MLKTRSRSPSLWLLVILVGFQSVGVLSATASEAIVPVCGILVARNARPEVLAAGTYDKFRHCSLSCIMTRACGPIESIEAGILKEVYDALGFGDPSLEDLRADLEGTQIGLDRTLRADKDCFKACDRVYPRNAEPAENFQFNF